MKQKTNSIKRNLGGIIVGVMALTSISLVALGSSVKQYGINRQIYQGWTKIGNQPSYVFDEKNRDVRTIQSRAPEFILPGADSLRNFLKIGKVYEFTTETSALPWSNPRIISVKECE